MGKVKAGRRRRRSKEEREKGREEKGTRTSMHIASALRPFLMFETVQYCVSWMTWPSRAVNCFHAIEGKQMGGQGKWNEMRKERKETVRTHHERLVEREHDDKLDAEELCERAAAAQLVLHEVVEQEQAVERDAMHTE